MALLRRLLLRPVRYAIVFIVKYAFLVFSRQALRGLAVEVVVGERQVHQGRQLANAHSNEPSQSIPCKIQLLQFSEGPEGLRQGPAERIGADVENRQVPEVANLNGQTPREIIVGNNDLIQSVAHLPNALRKASVEMVVRDDQNRDGRIPEVLRDRRREPVVVQEQGVELHVKQPMRQLPFEIVVPKIKVLKIRDR